MGTILGTVGIVSKGNYSASATYYAGNFVYYNGSTFLAKKDNLKGVTPAEGDNWQMLARGAEVDTSVFLKKNKVTWADLK